MQDLRKILDYCSQPSTVAELTRAFPQHNDIRDDIGFLESKSLLKRMHFNEITIYLAAADTVYDDVA